MHTHTHACTGDASQLRIPPDPFQVTLEHCPWRKENSGIFKPWELCDLIEACPWSTLGFLKLPLIVL